MATQEQQQNAVAEVREAAVLAYALRTLADEVHARMLDAVRDAHAAKVPQWVLAEATGLTPGRVSQIVAEAPERDSAENRRRLYEMGEWPGDALRPLRRDAPGRTILPPYGRRRAVRPQ
jgi:Fe2+ transport system protein FeoA